MAACQMCLLGLIKPKYIFNIYKVELNFLVFNKVNRGK